MKIAIVIVFYNPNKEHIVNATKIAHFCDVIVVDNSTNALQGVYNFKYICLRENRGIAFAQNFGIKEAREKRADFILFLDQDSIIDETYISCLLNEFDYIYKQDSRIAAIGPVVVNKRTGKEYKNYWCPIKK